MSTGNYANTILYGLLSSYGTFISHYGQIFTKTPVSTFLIRDSAEFPMEVSEENEVDAEGAEKRSDEVWASMESSEVERGPPAKRVKVYK